MHSSSRTGQIASPSWDEVPAHELFFALGLSISRVDSGGLPPCCSSSLCGGSHILLSALCHQTLLPLSSVKDWLHSSSDVIHEWGSVGIWADLSLCAPLRFFIVKFFSPLLLKAKCPESFKMPQLLRQKIVSITGISIYFFPLKSPPSLWRLIFQGRKKKRSVLCSFHHKYRIIFKAGDTRLTQKNSYFIYLFIKAGVGVGGGDTHWFHKWSLE